MRFTELPGQEIPYFQKERGEVIDLTALWEAYSVSCGVLAYDIDERTGNTQNLRLAREGWDFTAPFLGQWKHFPDYFFRRPRFWCPHQFRAGYLKESRRRFAAYNIPYALAERRARKLLREVCDSVQWDLFKIDGTVVTHSGDRVFVCGGYAGVHEFSTEAILVGRPEKQPKPIRKYCIHAKSYEYPQADLILMQMLMIRDNLEAFETTANMDVGEAHPEYDITKDWNLYPSQEQQVIYLARNAGADPHEHLKLEQRRVGPHYLMYGFNVKLTQEERKQLIEQLLKKTQREYQLEHPLATMEEVTKAVDDKMARITEEVEEQQDTID